MTDQANDALSRTAPDPGRLPELDSLRGLAALTVVLHHFGLIWPEWLNSVDGPGFHHARIGLLYPLYAGHEAVMLFFVLSGLVLALPYTRARSRPPYRGYLVRRVLRIYGPYLAALALSIAGAAWLHGPHSGWPEAFWSQPISTKLVLEHIGFIGVYDLDQFNFVIWSLVYEMRISIVFPLLCLLILRLRPAIAILLALAGSLPAIVFARHHSSLTPAYNLWMTFHFMAFFILGILLASHLSTIRAWYTGLHRMQRIALFAASFLAYNLSGRVSIHIPDLVAQLAGDWGVVLGAIGYIIVALNSAPARRLLNSAVPAFLGRISYSLYLVHAPILLTITFGLHGRLSAWAQFPIYLATTLAFATLFHKIIEQPLIDAGRRLSKTHAPGNAQLITA
jgi:peptidoglycan/LPS O-acetylase OafA/YrhL